MDDARFDLLTKLLVTPSRRSLLAAGGTVLAGLLGWDATTAAKPKRKKRKKKGKSKKRSCTPNCVGKGCGDANGCGGFCTACPQGTACVNNQCTATTCTPTCTGKNCGDGDGCGGTCTVQQGCGTNQTCINGRCVTTACNPPCADGRHCCDVFRNGTLSCTACCGDEDCVDDATANSQGRTTCFFGNCVCPTEKPQLCRGRCTDPLSDRTNCSAIAGDCGFACPPDWECCGGACAFLKGCLNGSRMTDCQRQHCGTCGTSCLTEGSACCEGSCVPENDENCGFCGNDCTVDGLTCCGGTCVDVDTNHFNCGECGNACAASEACCDGECTPLGTEENCSVCDDECDPGEQCREGICQ